jgi:predicted metalloprotease with PDZ domain
MTHEMFHLAFPDMGEGHEWLNEGLSTYLEPIARERIGILSKEEYWKELIEGLPSGLPEPGDRGLDNTHTWGRTYWGGAMFWFLADVGIREKTRNHKSLDDAMRAVLGAGGDGSVEWSVGRVGQIADHATGSNVVSQLYLEMSGAPVKPDLEALWRRLGVRLRDGHMDFDDSAPLAAVRRAMTESAKGTKPGAGPSSAG